VRRSRSTQNALILNEREGTLSKGPIGETPVQLIGTT
jgi:hypothetical protein